MQIRDLMTVGVEVIRPEASVQTAAEKMRDFNIGFLPVWDGKKLVGMLTDRDITVRAVAAGLDSNTPVRELMTPEIVFCYDDQSLDEAPQIMQEHQIRQLPVLDAKHQLVGVVSLDDIAAVDQTLAGNILERVSEPIQARER